jgi:chaperone modulatory protein CbpM
VKFELTEAVWLDDRGAVSLVELSECSGLTENDVRDLVDLGAIQPLDPDAYEPRFAARCISAARAARRLRDDFELDSHGVALALALLERVEALENALQHLDARLPRTHR